MRLGTVTLLKAPLDRTLEWVAYHLNSGIDEMHLFFDDPEDPAIEALRGYPQIHSYPCDDDFWRDRTNSQRPPQYVQYKQRAILKSLLKDPPPQLDWFVHIDSDELLWAPKGVRRTFAAEARGVTHVQIEAMEAVPPNPNMTDPFRQVRLFKERRPERYDWAIRLGAGTTFRGRRFFRGYVLGKPAIKLDGSVVEMRTHGPTEVVDRRYRKRVARELRILHFDAGSYEDWLAKWNMRDQHSKKALSKARRQQARRFARASRSGNERDLQELYASDYLLTAHDARRLRLIGLVRKVTLDERLFVLPSPS